MEFEEFKNQLCGEFIDKYKEYCKKKNGDELSVRTFDNYGSHLNKTNDYLNDAFNYAKNNKKSYSDLNNELNKASKKLPFKIEKEKKDYLFLIAWCLNNGDKLYAMTIYDLMYNLLKTTKEELSNNNIPKDGDLYKHISNSLAAFNYLQDFLIFYDTKNQINNNKNNVDLFKVEADNFANVVRKKINKKDLHKLDGMDPLIAQLKTDGFIKLAIESSYFFDVDLINDQQIEIDIRNPARSTKDKTIYDVSSSKNNKDHPVYVIDKHTYKVSIDTDNNTAVRSLINEKTGITVGIGKGSILQNIVISHVWGRAYDPRYFTSLWNIVLIPAWANSLMDKEDAVQGSLASKMRATFMAACRKIYIEKFKNKAYWNSLGMNGVSPRIKNKKDVISGDYTLSILNGKDSKKPKVIILALKEVSI